MKKFLALSLVSSVVLAVIASESLARGGHGGGGHGGGGGHAGGGHPGGHAEGHAAEGHHENFQHQVSRPAAHQGEYRPAGHNVEHREGQANHRDENHNQHQAENRNRGRNDRHGYQPYSRDWYAHHPNAWGYRRPWYNGWAGVGFGAAAAWLGLEAFDGGTTLNNTYYTSDSSDGNNNDNSNTWNNSGDNNSSNSAVNTQAPSGNEQFLPLGIFTLASAGATDATAYVQLAIAHDGEVRGSYFDVISDQELPVQGSLDKRTQQVSWTTGQNQGAVFQTSLRNLTEDTGRVTVRLTDGTNRQLTLNRESENRASGQRTSSVEGTLIDE